MIKLSINFFKQTGKPEIKKNAADASGSNMNDLPNAGSKIFSAGDLWNIQRKGKNLMPRRWSF